MPPSFNNAPAAFPVALAGLGGTGMPHSRRCHGQHVRTWGRARKRPQVMIALLAPWVGYWSELWGRKGSSLPASQPKRLRGVLFTFVTDPSQLIFVQLLDGITGAIVTALTILIIADLTTGTGRFNLTQNAPSLRPSRLSQLPQMKSATASPLFSPHSGYQLAVCSAGFDPACPVVVLIGGVRIVVPQQVVCNTDPVRREYRPSRYRGVTCVMQGDFGSRGDS